MGIAKRLPGGMNHGVNSLRALVSTQPSEAPTEFHQSHDRAKASHRRSSEAPILGGLKVGIRVRLSACSDSTTKGQARPCLATRELTG